MTALTVVIPAYNSSAVIHDAIESAWRSGAETVLVIDDGSTDETAVVAAKAGAQVHSQLNAGASVARQHGAALVDTPLVIFLDADDELIPTGVRGSVSILDTDPSLAVAAGVVVGFSRRGAAETRFPIRYSPVNTSTLLQVGYGPWPPANAVVRVSALREAESLQPEALNPRYADDYELLIRLSRAGGIHVRDETTCRYSMDGGKSVRSAAQAVMSKENVRRHYADAYGIDIQAMSDQQVAKAAQARIARAHRASGNWPGFVAASIRWAALAPADTVTRFLSRAASSGSPAGERRVAR